MIALLELVARKRNVLLRKAVHLGFHHLLSFEVGFIAKLWIVFVKPSPEHL